MNRGFWGYYVNGWVNTSPTTPLPGFCTSGQILLTDSDVTQSKICPDVQRPGRGVVGLVMTHCLTWYPQIPRFMKVGIEKIMDRCVSMPKITGQSLSAEEYQGSQCQLKYVLTRCAMHFSCCSINSFWMRTMAKAKFFSNLYLIVSAAYSFPPPMPPT